jgi:hypothetical protein
MAINVQNLAELDVTKVQQTLEFIQSLLQESAPEIDLKRGVLHDLLLYYSSILATANQTNVDLVRQSSSLLAIQQNPALADTDTVDRVLSNYLITRKTGTKSVGSVTIVVDTLESVTVPSGTSFVANNKTFKTQVPYTGVISSANATSAGDMVLQPRGDGNYYFVIEVSAQDVGSDGLLKKDTVLVPQAGILNFVKAYATSDFLGGSDTETNAELMARLQEGIAAKTLSNRVNVTSLIKDEFNNVSDVSIIGFGDAEMTRDRHSIFPVSYGGRVDVYLRSQGEPMSLGLSKTATLIAKDSNNRGTWQFSITRDEAPGFYDITSIRPTDVDEVFGSFAITREIRGLDKTNISAELTPDLSVTAEGAYSRYQTATVQFIDSLTDVSSLSVGDTAEYSITLRVMPNIADIQTLLGKRATRNVAGDVLVKAATPCFVSLAFTLQGKPGAQLPDIAAIKAALATYVNNLGFCGRLYASALSDIVHNYLPENVALGAVDMFGQIRRPNGTVKPIRSTELLVIPDEPDNYVTPRTVIFILNQEDIFISAATVNIPMI